MSQLKLDENGHAVLENGLPVWVLDDGKEVSYDAPKLFASVAATREERDTAQDRAKELEKTLRKFGTTDEAREKALERLAAPDAKKSTKEFDEAKLEELVNQRMKPFTEQAEAEKKQLADQVVELGGKLRSVLVSSKFSTAKAIADTYLTPDLAEAKFGVHFSVEGDTVVAYRDPATKKDKIYSKTDPSKVADFDEALGILVTGNENYKRWKRASNANGGGAVGGDTVGASGADLSGLAPEERLTRALAAPKAN